MFNHEELQVFFRDRFVHFRDATISVANSGFLYGLGVFTGMRAHLNRENGELFIFRPEDHFRRLQFSARLCQFKNFLANYDYPKFRTLLVDLLKTNNIREDAYFRVTIFSDENKITPKLFYYNDSLCAYLYPMGDYIPTTGIKVSVSSWRRIEDNCIPARAKIVGGYVNSALAKTEALQHGFDEAIFLDRNGHVVEGSAENIFLFVNGELVTPPVNEDILEGITRATIMQLAVDLGYRVVERSVDRTELYKAEEIFLTGTGAQVSPVVKVDSYDVGGGAVGPVARAIQQLYWRVVRGMEAQYASWLLKVEP